MLVRRKSSVRTTTYASAGRIKDPRPVSDRAFKDKSIRQLVEVRNATVGQHSGLVRGSLLPFKRHLKTYLFKRI